MNHYVVVRKEEKPTYTGGLGFQDFRVLRELGFPPGPYSRAGADTLVRQAKSVDSRLKLVPVKYIEQ